MNLTSFVPSYQKQTRRSPANHPNLLDIWETGVEVRVEIEPEAQEQIDLAPTMLSLKSTGKYYPDVAKPLMGLLRAVVMAE